MSVITYQLTHKKIQAQLARLGDLPVFSATLNRIRELSSSEDSDAMMLAMAVMKDANLSARLLRVANTPEFNRGAGEVAAISRAVVLLGFERIKNLSLSLKLIESFTKAYPNSGVETLLQQAFLHAALTREIASQAQLREMEEVFLCGLLFNLGELVVACTLPTDYQQIRQAQKEGGTHVYVKAQLQLLGGQFSDIGQDIAQSWGFPSDVVSTMDRMTAERSNSGIRKRHTLLVVTQQLLDTIYHPKRAEQVPDSVFCTLNKQFGITDKQLERALDNACKLAADMSAEYRISLKPLVPALRDTGDMQVDEYIRHMAYFFHSRQQLVQADQSAQQADVPASDATQSQPQKQQAHLGRLAQMTADKVSAQTILAEVVTSIYQCAAFDRVMFALANKSTGQLVMRICDAQAPKPLEAFFSAATQPDVQRLFFQLLKREVTLWVPDTHESGWRERLPARFLKEVAPAGFIASPLIVGKRQIGLFYADALHHPISETDFGVFNQFVLQAKVALVYQQ